MSKYRKVKVDLGIKVKQGIRNPVSIFMKFQLKAKKEEHPDFKMSKEYMKQSYQAGLLHITL